ncbi:MAG: cyclic nucleotide-binding domain-containing protein [Myxococcales bacterium]|nr:cyclic nucleotide-binding domain-containing protein [Myxococcales bacterium]
MSSAAAWARRVGPAAAFQFAFVAAVALVKSAANALVLSRYQAGALPYLYLGAAALTAALTGLAAGRKGKGASHPLALCLAGAALTGAVAAGIRLGVSSLALALYLFAEAFATYVAISFWSTVDDAFDPREAKRAFTEVNGIGMAGGVVGGLAAQELAPRFGANALLIAGTVALAFAAAAFHFHRAAPLGQTQPRASGAEVWSYLRSNGYAKVLAGLVLLLAVASAFADFAFRQRASRSLGEDELAALFGNLQLWMALFCVAFQLLLAERLLRGIGLLRYLALVPALLAPLAAVSLFEPALWPAYLLKLFESAASLSIVPVAMQLLYAPMPDGLRDGVRTSLDGLAKKGGLALAGVLLIGAGAHAWGPALPAALLALCAAVALVLLRLRPRYVGALQERVAGAGPAPEAALAGVGSKLLVDALDSPLPERVLHALSLMEQAAMDLRPHLGALLSHQSERVLERGVQLAVSLQAREEASRIEALLWTGHRRPRDEAAWALSQLAPSRAVQVLPPLIESRDIGLRCAAIGALMGIEGGYRAQLALQQLAAKGELAPASERREVARLLGRLRDPRWAKFLGRYLEDGDSSVRRIAIAAAGEGGYLSLAPRLLPFLTWREERRNAREAISKFGDELVPMLEQALNDRARSSALRYELPRVLRQIGSRRALEALVFSNIRDDAFLHYRIGVAISRLREDHPELKVDGQWVREAIGRRREVYRTLLDPFRDLRAGLGDRALLTRAIGDRLDQAYELSFWLLGLLYDSRALRRVHSHVVGSDPRRRAYALELLENLVPEEDRALILEQTFAHHRELPAGAGGRLSEHLGVLCHTDDHVLRACARQVARGAGLWTLPPLEDDMSEATVKRMFALEGVEIFAQSDVDDLSAVAAVSREQTFRKGERIYSEGDPGDALYVILKGSVVALRGGEHVLTLREKEAFGEVSLLDGSPRPTDVVASEEVSVLVIDRRDFLDLVSDRPELLKGVFRAVSQQLKRVLDLPGRRNTGESKVAG